MPPVTNERVQRSLRTRAGIGTQRGHFRYEKAAGRRLPLYVIVLELKHMTILRATGLCEFVLKQSVCSLQASQPTNKQTGLRNLKTRHHYNKHALEH